MPAERRQVVSRITSPANGASVRPSRRRTTALPSAAAAAATATSVDFGRNTRSSAEFTRGLDDAAAAAAYNAAHNHNAAGNTQPQPHAHAHSHAHTHTLPHAHNRTLSSSGFGGTGATTTTTTAVHHRSRPSISRPSRPQSVYQIVEAYRPLAYSIEKAEQEAKAAAAEEKRRSLVLSPLQTTMMTTQPAPLAEDDDAMDIDEFGQFSPATPTTAPALLTPSNGNNNNQFEDDDFAVLRSPTRGKHQEECISGRGMLKRGYHIILDTPLENSEEARWAAIKRMEAQLRELDKSFTRVAPPSRRRITNVTNHASASTAATAPSPASFSAANRAAWNI